MGSQTKTDREIKSNRQEFIISKLFFKIPWQGALHRPRFGGMGRQDTTSPASPAANQPAAREKIQLAATRSLALIFAGIVPVQTVRVLNPPVRRPIGPACFPAQSNSEADEHQDDLKLRPTARAQRFSINRACPEGRESTIEPVWGHRTAGERRVRSHFNQPRFREPETRDRRIGSCKDCSHRTESNWPGGRTFQPSRAFEGSQAGDGEPAFLGRPI